MQVGVQEVNFNEDTQIPYTVARCRTEFRFGILHYFFATQTVSLARYAPTPSRGRLEMSLQLVEGS